MLLIQSLQFRWNLTLSGTVSFLLLCDGHYSIATPLRPLSVPDSEVLRLLLRPDALNNLDLLAAGQLNYLSHRVLGLMDTYQVTKARVT